MNQRTFKATNGLELIIKNRKSAVIFEIDQNQDDKNLRFAFSFQEEEFHELFKYIESIANQSWTNLIPKEATSMGADYDEYYDRELDNNGYLSIKSNEIHIGRPSKESVKMYQFNKRKMESFLYDFGKMTTAINV